MTEEVASADSSISAESLKAAHTNRPRNRIWLALSGAVLVILGWVVYAEMLRGVIPYIGQGWMMGVLAALGAWAGIGRFRKWAWGFASLAVCLLLFVGFSPLVPWGMRGLLRADPLEKAPAVVVLAAGVNRHGAINAVGRARLDKGLELLGEGYAPVLVLTEAVGRGNNWVPIVKERIRKMGLSHPVESVGPVINTHDEAVLAARLAKAKGWSHLILVTHPWHMRRAAAVFEKQGVRVVCAPCEEIEYDPRDMRLGGQRVRAFHDWAHEVGALAEYRLKGWID